MRQHLRDILHRTIEYPASTEDTDATLRAFEQQAWEVYHEVAATLSIRPCAGPLGQFLVARLLPGFMKLGFPEAFTRSIFCLASPAWEVLSDLPNNVVYLHPNMRKDLENVRQGLMLQAEKRLSLDLTTIFLSPQASYDMVQESMDPANLYRVLDDIATPWIILPRAYNTLQRDQARFLPAYLELIDSETNESVLHIFTRIAIEFFTNYSMRFMDNHHSRKQVMRLLIAGYMAMYWKCLRTPPRGMEEVRVFEHYFHWLKYSGICSRLPDDETQGILRTMKALKDDIFSRRSNHHQDHSVHSRGFGMDRFVVALRHGCLGIASALRYFSGLSPQTGLPFDKGMAWGSILFDLKALFEVLSAYYGKETRRTQYFIQDFVFQLDNAYAFLLSDDASSSAEGIIGTAFLRQKIATMIWTLRNELQAISK